jgi:ribosomal protein S14
MYQTKTKAREYREGRIGRRRTYTCRKCGSKFQVFTNCQLPIGARICPECRDNPEIKAEYMAAFDKVDKSVVKIKMERDCLRDLAPQGS